MEECPRVCAADYLSLVYKIVLSRYRHLSSEIDQRDVLQNGMVGLVCAARDYDPAGHVPFPTYARLRILWAIQDGWRSQYWYKRHARIPKLLCLMDAQKLAAWCGAEPAGDVVFRTRVDQACRKLPPHEQTVLQRIYGEDHSLQDVAQELGVCESRISQLRTKALATLRQQLQCQEKGNQ